MDPLGLWLSNGLGDCLGYEGGHDHANSLANDLANDLGHGLGNRLGCYFCAGRGADPATRAGT
jgi:hypothetical protein